MLINPFGDGPHTLKVIDGIKFTAENWIQLRKHPSSFLNGWNRKEGGKLKNKWLLKVHFYISIK